MMKVKPTIYKQALKLKRLSNIRSYHSNIFHASEAGDCTREIYFRHLNRASEKKFDSEEEEARVEMLLADGRFHQAQVTSYLQQAPGIHVTDIERDGVLIEGPIIITGHPDGIIHNVKLEESAVLEIKGVSTWVNKYAKFVDGDVETLKASDTGRKAIPQARLYMKMFGKLKAVIVVKDKNDSGLWEFEIEHNEVIYRKIIDKFLSIHKSIESNKDTGVFCDFMPNDKRSKFCNFSGECGYGR